MDTASGGESELTNGCKWHKADMQGTPAEIIERLNQGIKTRLADMGGTPLSGSPADYGTC
jgi:hypothetical protein